MKFMTFFTVLRERCVIFVLRGRRNIAPKLGMASFLPVDKNVLNVTISAEFVSPKLSHEIAGVMLLSTARYVFLFRFFYEASDRSTSSKTQTSQIS